MPRLFTFLIISLSFNIVHSQEFIWGTSFGSSGNDVISGTVVDSLGNNYHTGYFSENLIFEESPIILSSLGNDDVFVTKFNKDGQLIWAKQISGSDDEFGHELVILDDGTLLLYGRFKGTVDFDMGDDEYLIPSNGSGFNTFITNFDQDGNFIKAFHFQGNGDNTPYRMKLDQDESIYLSGRFNGNFDADPGMTTSKITLSGGGTDSYLIKLDREGNYQWSKHFSGPQGVLATNFDIYNNEVYYGGNFQSSIKILPENTQTKFSLGINDCFFAKILTDGTLDTLITYGSVRNDQLSSVQVDSTGIFLFGDFNSEIDINPDPTTEHILTSNGGVDAYILALDSDFEFVWSKNFGGSAPDYPLSSLFNQDRNLLYGIRYSSTINIDVSGEILQFTTAGGTDYAILEIDPSNGNVSSVYDIKGPGSEGGRPTLLESGELIIAGFFDGTADFNNFGTNDYLMSSQGGFDAFIIMVDFKVTSSLNTFTPINPVSLSPVPANTGERLNFSLNDFYGLAKIIDFNGRTLYTETISSSYIDLPSNLLPGLYNLILSSESGVYYTGKFIVL
jgi:hypothetical protein